MIRQTMPLEINGNDYLILSTNTNKLKLVKANKNTGGLEMYFIKEHTIPGPKWTAVNTLNYGIIVTKEATVRTIAHEIMHSARNYADDPTVGKIYDIYDYDGSYFIPEDLNILKNNIPSDWGGGYYPSALKQYILVQKLLQYGYPMDSKIDIPRGDIYGLDYNNTLKNIECGFNKVNGRIFEDEN